jgi:hypothetical protein
MPAATLQHNDNSERFAKVVVVRHRETSWTASRIVHDG